MFDKLKLNSNLREKYDELFELGSKQKEMYSNFKSTCREKKINKYIKSAIVSTIYSPTTLKDFKNLEEHYSTIIKSIPKYKQKNKKESLCAEHKLYTELLSIIKENFRKYPEKQYAIKKQSFPNTNIYDLLGIVEKVTTTLHKDIIDSLIEILKYSNNETKIELAIKTFLLCDIGIDTNLINDIVYLIRDLNNETTLEELNTIIGKVYYINSENFMINYKPFISLIKSKKNGEYDECLLKNTIDVLFENGYLINYLYIPEINLICEMLKKDNNIGDVNKKAIIAIVSEYNFYRLKDKVLRKTILNTLLEINIKDEKYIWLYKSFMLDIFVKCKCDNIKKYLLEKLKMIKSVKSLELIVNLYPNILKYINVEDSIKVIDNIVEFENLGSTMKKVLVIPIKNDK